MLTYELKKRPGLPLYESLYRAIREDIRTGRLAPGEKLPSKRALATNLKVSLVTVEEAYDQLAAEGYLFSKPRVGYFVEHLTPRWNVLAENRVQPREKSAPVVDLTDNGPADFPFSVWSRLQREVMQDHGRQLLQPLPNQGYEELRRAIAENLAEFRGMQVSPDQILVGAGTDFLYNLIIQLLGRDKVYAVEEPGYGKIQQIYAAGGARWVCAAMDRGGVIPESFGDAQVLHLSPEHHFPTGVVTGMERRREILAWLEAGEDRYVIEDDFDSEFRFRTRPLPTLQSLDTTGRVLYMNTFSKTLAPSIRISYLVLQPRLMEEFSKRLGFYSCTVPSFEQYTLARFLSRGYFEKHINRMRRFYKNRREQVIGLLRDCRWADRLTTREEDAGLHLLVKVDCGLSDRELTGWLMERGIRAKCLSEYYRGPCPKEDSGFVVVNYSGLRQEDFAYLEQILGKKETAGE